MAKKIDLYLHCGGDRVRRQEVDEVPVPSHTASWYPVPHGTVVDLVEEAMTDAGLSIVHQVHALSSEGRRYFGMMQVKAKNEKKNADHALILGVRNAHDKRFPAALVAGSGVFVCDNLAFSGEIKLGRKHTRHILRDLPGVVKRAVGKLGDARHTQDTRFAHYKNSELSREQANHIVIQALEAGIIPSTRVIKVIEQLRDPNHPEFEKDGYTAWRLFNAFTEVLKKSPLFKRPRITMALHGLMDTATGLVLATKSEGEAAVKAIEGAA